MNYKQLDEKKSTTRYPIRYVKYDERNKKKNEYSHSTVSRYKNAIFKKRNQYKRKIQDPPYLNRNVY